MDADLERVVLPIMQAREPEELFGAVDIILPARQLLELLAAEYEKFRPTTDPDRYQNPEDREVATDARQKLDRFYEEAQSRIQRYHYGLPGFAVQRPAYATKSFVAGRNRYFIGAKLAADESCVLYQGFLERDGLTIGEVLIKVAQSPSENHLVDNEARILSILHRCEVPQWKHLPMLLDRFESAGRLGLLRRKISGFSLERVRMYPTHKDGVDQRDMIWMLDRALSALGYVHSQGVVHANLQPANILIQPLSHNVILDGWGAAVHKPAITGERVNVASSIFSAPEVKEKGHVGPWSDVYSLGKVLIWLLGGDAESNEIPQSVEAKIRSFLLRMVRQEADSRPADCWELWSEENRIKDALWKRQFRHFDIQ